MAEFQRISTCRTTGGRLPPKDGQIGICIGKRTTCAPPVKYTCTALLSKQEAALNLTGDGYKLWEFIASGAAGWNIMIDASKCIDWGITEENYHKAIQELLHYGYLQLDKNCIHHYLIFIERPGVTDSLF